MWYPRRSALGRAGAALLTGVLALGLAQLVAGPTGSASTEQAAGPHNGKVTANVRIASFNTSAQLSPRKAMADLRDLLARKSPDIVALQEMSSWKKRSRVMKRLLDCDACELDGWVPIRAVQGGTSILWRSDRFRLLDKGWIEVVPETYVGPRGAGPSTLHAKYVVWVKLRDRTTGRKVWVLNNHFVPTVQTSDGGRNSNKRRARVYRQHMEGVQALISDIRQNRGGGLIYVTGDFNVNYRRDKEARDPIFPYVRMEQSRLRSSYRALREPGIGTHTLKNGFDKRLIDYVHYTMTRRNIPLRQGILRGMNSDHRPILMDLRIVGLGCFKRGERIC